MPHDRLDQRLSGDLQALEQSGTAKGAEAVITDILPPGEGRGPRYLLADSSAEFLKMNSNS